MATVEELFSRKRRLVVAARQSGEAPVSGRSGVVSHSEVLWVGNIVVDTVRESDTDSVEFRATYVGSDADELADSEDDGVAQPAAPPADVPDTVMEVVRVTRATRAAFASFHGVDLMTTFRSGVCTLEEVESGTAGGDERRRFQDWTFFLLPRMLLHKSGTGEQIVGQILNRWSRLFGGSGADVDGHDRLIRLNNALTVPNGWYTFGRVVGSTSGVGSSSRRTGTTPV